MGRAGSNSGERAFSIQRCVGMLHQNKHVAREEGLKDLVAALEGFVAAEDITDHRYEYDQALSRCFSFLSTVGRSAKEHKDAYRAIGIYVLTVLGFEAQNILDRLFALDRLTAELTPSSASEAERAVAAINCLTAVTLVCAKKAAAAKRTLKAVCEVIDQTTFPQVLAAALSAWTLLLPRAGNLRAMTPFKVIAKHLSADDPAVRMAAGEALAVCIERNHRPYQPDPPYLYRYHGLRPREPKPEDRPSLESRVAELAAGVDAHKKKHAEERILFQQIKDLLEANPPGSDDQDEYDEGEEEEEDSSGCRRVKVNKTTWVKLVLVNFLRQYLAEQGFAAHFQLNVPLFRDTLGLTRAAGGAQEKKGGVVPAQEMKQLRNGRDKQRTKEIKKDRRNKNKQYC
uniref:Uncharacterized protein n=1 Tax=Avena sativa TaxID=4498 RepID=A0ACD5Y2D5_AVESA